MSLVNRIIAVGSPHGDDQVAWRLAERLQLREGIGASMVALGDPSKLHDHLEECDRLIVVDACRSGGSPGSITRLEWPDERIERQHSHSTHGFGIADALQLAEKLDRLPASVVLFGIEVSQCQPNNPLSDVADSALNELEEKVLREMQ